MKNFYNEESTKIFNRLKSNLKNLQGGTTFHIGKISIEVTGRDGLGGLIEEWFGIWAKKKGFKIKNPKKDGNSQTFPDYYVGKDNHLLEVKTFDSENGPKFDLANFESYCESVAQFPERVNSDYLIFEYKLDNIKLSITNIWLKKIWEITCASARYPLKTQVKRNVIYNIRPASWFAKNPKFKPFKTKEEFIDALFATQKIYRDIDNKKLYLSNL